MGRRALPKIRADLDLTDYLKTVDELPKPWDPLQLFERDAPLEVEIGSGKGLFLRSATEANPDSNYLGVEIAGKYARFAAAGLAKRSLRNGVMVSGDAVPVLFDILPEGIAAFHVYFPDPWWKARHRKRRIMREEIVRRMEHLLIPGGSLHFWTDVKEYFDVTLELLAQVTTFEGPLEVAPHEPEHDLDYRTHFERRMRLHDKPVYRSLYHKPRTTLRHND